MTSPEASVVIRTLNEERYLPLLLDSISRQQASPSYEIIIVDSGSTDETVSIAKAHGCRVLHIDRNEFSFGRSLNRGCDAARGNYLVFISGHCIPQDPYWLCRLTAPLMEDIVDLSYGRQFGGAETQWSEHLIFSKCFPSQSQVPQPGFYCNNANSAIKTSIWREYRFDEELTGLEDVHLAKRLVTNGGRIGYVTDAAVFHCHHESWRQVKKRFEREALALQLICPELLMRKRDFFRYLAAAIAGDLRYALREGVMLRHLYSVIRYRYAQYWGTWCGHDGHRRLTEELRDSYFYPTPSRGRTLQAGFTLRNSISVSR